MNKTDLYNEIAYEMVLSKKEARQVVDMVFDLMAKALIAGDEIKITDFFSLKVIDKPSRMYRLAGMDEPAATDPGKRVRLRMSDTIMKEIDPAFKPRNKKKADEE